MRGVAKVQTQNAELNRIQQQSDDAVRRLELVIREIIAPARQSYETTEQSGLYKSNKFAGRAKIYAGNDSMIIQNPEFREVDDAFAILRTQDATMLTVSANVTKGFLNITGNTTCTNDAEVFWQVIRG